jgi:cytochrome P450
VSTAPPEVAESVLTQTAWWLARPIQFLEHCRRHHGETFTVRFARADKPLVFLSDPEAIRSLYTDPHHGLTQVRRARLEPVVGADSIFLLDSGPEHIERRKIVAPGFHGESIRHTERIVREVTEREMREWPRGGTLPLCPRMQTVTVEVIVRAVFGITEPTLSRQLREMLAELLGRSRSTVTAAQLLLRSLSSRADPLTPGLRTLLDRIDRVLFAEIAKRRLEDPAERKDVMSLLVASRFEDGSALSDREVRNQLITLLLAGTETTAVSLAWAFDLILRHPEVLSRLTEGGEDDAYLRAVVHESLRLRPNVLFIGRRLESDLRVGEYTVPAGFDAATSPWLTHTRADLYPDPLAFRPERFLDRKPQTYRWIPFGGGARRCVGAAFAEAEMRVMLDTIVRSISLQPATPRPERVQPHGMVLFPRKGTLVRVGPSLPRSEARVATAA